MDHELAIDAVQDGLQVVPFPRVLAVEELQHPHLRQKYYLNAEISASWKGCFFLHTSEDIHVVNTCVWE